MHMLESSTSVYSQLARLLNQPLPLGDRTLSGRLILAPMTGLTHTALRELISEFGGCALFTTEMCSSKSLPAENRAFSPYFRWQDKERKHLVCQILGKDPGQMADAARRVEMEKLFGIDLNFGCSTRLICKTHGGAAILKDPVLCFQIVSAVRKAVKFPLMVKFRTGWEDNPDTAVALAKCMEDAGADALTFHPRVAPDRRTRPPKWEYIAEVKSAVDIPVFGNGNVFTAQDCFKMLTMTGCDGVSVGRMAVAQPWLFARWSGKLNPEPGIYLQTAKRMASLLQTHFDVQTALRRYKKFAFYFSANFQFGHTLHRQIANTTSLEKAERALELFFKEAPQVCARPNMNLFT